MIKAAILATLVFFGIPALLWAIFKFEVVSVIAQWLAIGIVGLLMWGGLFAGFGGFDD